MSGSRSVAREMAPVDAALVHGWLCARSIARGLPIPVAEHGGWRVDTRSDAELCRYVFAEAGAGLRDLAQQIARPKIFLKLCSDDAALRGLLPPQWALLDRSWVMTGPQTPLAEHQLPPGYAATIEHRDNTIGVTIVTADGALAASGYAVEQNGVFAYDRIVTAPDHQRRGLGRAMMGLLGAQARSASAQHVLVATDQGRALYTNLGWEVRAPYASAVIPDRAA